MDCHLFGAKPLAEPVQCKNILGAIISDILIEIHNFKFRKMHLKMSSARCSHFDPASHIKYPLPNPDKAQQTQNVYIVFRV